MADKTIGGEGIRQDWRIDIKAANEQKTTNDNNRIYETNIIYIISVRADDGGSAVGTAGEVERRRNG